MHCSRQEERGGLRMGEVGYGSGDGSGYRY